MLNVPVEARYIRIVFFNDDETPWQFVVDLLTSVFGKTLIEASKLATAIATNGEATCGIYPPGVAEALSAAAQKQIADDGHPLKLSCRSMMAGDPNRSECSFCSAPPKQGRSLFKGKSGQICDDCILIGIDDLSDASQGKQFKYAHQAIAWHFAGIPKDQLVTSSRRFPGHMRPDVQAAIDTLFSAPSYRFLGIYEEHRYETLTLAALTKESEYAPTIAPASIKTLILAMTIRCAA